MVVCWSDPLIIIRWLHCQITGHSVHSNGTASMCCWREFDHGPYNLCKCLYVQFSISFTHFLFVFILDYLDLFFTDFWEVTGSFVWVVGLYIMDAFIHVHKNEFCNNKKHNKWWRISLLWRNATWRMNMDSAWNKYMTCIIIKCGNICKMYKWFSLYNALVLYRCLYNASDQKHETFCQ